MRNPDMISRRSFGQWTALVAASLPALRATTATATVRFAPELDLTTPKSALRAYMKLHTSLERARIWYWYTGIFEAALAEGPVVPVVAIDTLIRRDVSPMADGTFRVEMFEANYFHEVGNATPLLHMLNPLNGREVTPFHYREGPHVAIYSERGIYGAAAVPPPATAVFAPRWQRAGDQIWTTNTFYINGPYPLPIATWPLEGNTRERVGSFANLFGSAKELADPGITTANCTFTYEAFMEWWPWMEMGATAGQMLWHAGGRKLHSLADLPPESRIGFEAIHPEIFEERPWETFSMMAIDYQKQRHPVLR
jgi:hypothetical protein